MRHQLVAVTAKLWTKPSYRVKVSSRQSAPVSQANSLALRRETALRHMLLDHDDMVMTFQCGDDPIAVERLHGMAGEYDADLPTAAKQVFDEKTLAAADIEHPIARFEPKVLDYIHGDRDPSPIITVTAVAGVARPVEIFASILTSDTDVFGALGDCSHSDVAPLRADIGAAG